MEGYRKITSKQFEEVKTEFADILTIQEDSEGMQVLSIAYSSVRAPTIMGYTIDKEYFIKNG